MRCQKCPRDFNIYVYFSLITMFYFNAFLNYRLICLSDPTRCLPLLKGTRKNKNISMFPNTHHKSDTQKSQSSSQALAREKPQGRQPSMVIVNFFQRFCRVDDTVVFKI